jgi:threonyl-tRNA synthetase
MQRIVKERQIFERREVSREEAMRLGQAGRLGALGERAEPSRFKLDIIENLGPDEVISLYQNGAFLDLCAGPHIPDTGGIGAFKLTSVASAYYKGDEKNPQLQRIYGTAFASQKELDDHFAMLEEAKKRDHRKLGKEMQLFTFDDDTGPGLPLWLPNGTVLIEELEKLAKEMEFKAGYQRVRTPHIARKNMYLTSGHLPYYKESMFPPMVFDEGDGSEPKEYYLKAMNCPHHHKLFAAVPRSYRDLPLRLAEYGTCYRFEQSGELFGLMRVRSLQMNDAHIYCTEAQFAEEFRAVNEMYLAYFKLFGLERYRMRFSKHNPAKLGQKYVDAPELWVKTEAMVREVLVSSGVEFIEVEDEAAFYGPKIDVQVWSAIGREFTLATNQVDFYVPGRFSLEYTTPENTKATPLCIHRAPLGTHERFIGFLIEHYAGHFPLWMSPEQVRIIPITDAQVPQAMEWSVRLRNQGIRCTVDTGKDKMGAKIRLAQIEKVFYMAILGGREAATGSVSVRSRDRGDLGTVVFDDWMKGLVEAIAART